MAGPTLNPDSVNSNGSRIYSAAYTFNGGGTQTVLTPGAGETWLLYAMVYNYGGNDFRHGDMCYAAKTINGSPSTFIRFTTLADFGNSAFADDGAGSISYTAGGGNPYTQIFMLRLI
jgi:hypothetical protein